MFRKSFIIMSLILIITVVSGQVINVKQNAQKSGLSNETGNAAAYQLSNITAAETPKATPLKVPEQVPADTYKVTYKATRQSRVPILMYHSINDKPLGLEQLSVKTKDFERQIKYLSDNDYTPLFFDELKNSGNYKKPVVITFDDGYSDNFYNAYPILLKYNFKATVFVIVKDVGRKGFLMENQISQMKGLVSFQSHTLNHRELDKISGKEIENECASSKKALSEITKEPVYVLSYPAGKFNEKVADIASKYYDYAVTTRPGYYSAADGNYKINRIRISRSDTLSHFISKVGIKT